jgi:predicted DCC family thiol-disulfide oxidoreductase YuxK
MTRASDRQELTFDQTQGRGIEIVYDGECPFCSAYVRLARLRDAAGPVRLVDARGDDPLAVSLRGSGVDLDRGMVVRLDGQIHHGDAAMVVLSALSTGSGAFNRLMRAMFRRPARARILYPALVAGRNLTLRLLGRRRISEVMPRGS